MIDIANLRHNNIQDDHLKFIRQKIKDTTSHKTEIVVCMIPEIWDIVNCIGAGKKEPESYIFNILSDGMTAAERHKRVKQHIKNTNKYLKKIEAKVGIDEKITTYWARHTYSTILKRLGAPVEFISEQLGHQSKKVIQNYLDSFEDEQRERYSACLLEFMEDDE